MPALLFLASSCLALPALPARTELRPTRPNRACSALPVPDHASPGLAVPLLACFATPVLAPAWPCIALPASPSLASFASPSPNLALPRHAQPAQSRLPQPRFRQP